MKKSIAEMEEKLKQSKQLQKEESKLLDKMLEETNERLKNALKSNNLVEKKMAQAMLETVTNMRSKERDSVSKTSGLQGLISKRKSTLITSFVAKKTKLKE